MTNAEKKGRLIICTQFTERKSNSTGYFWSLLLNKLREDYEVVSVSCDNTRSGPDNYRVKVKNYNKNRMVERALGLLNQSLKLSKKLLSVTTKSDVVITGSNPVFLILLIPWVKWRIDCKWILIIHDLYPWNIFRGPGVFDEFARKCLIKLFVWSYNQCSHIVVIGRDMQEILESETCTPVAYIPNWLHSDDVKQVERHEAKILQKLKWDRRFVVFQFFGNLGQLQGLENLLAAIDLVKSQKARFLFIGDGSAVESVLEVSARRDNVEYIGTLCMDSNHEGLAACDVAIVSLAQGLYGVGVPSKFYFSLAAGRGVLAVMDSGTEIYRSVQELGVGWTCAAGNPVSLAAKIDEICEGSYKSIGENCRSIFEAELEAEIQLSKLKNIVRQVCAL